MQKVEYRLEPALRAGGLWFVEVATGNRKKRTRRSVAVSEPVYTLAQAQCFCSNNRVSDFTPLLK